MQLRRKSFSREEEQEVGVQLVVQEQELLLMALQSMRQGRALLLLQTGLCSDGEVDVVLVLLMPHAIHSITSTQPNPSLPAFCWPLSHVQALAIMRQ